MTLWWYPEVLTVRLWPAYSSFFSTRGSNCTSGSIEKEVPPDKHIRVSSWLGPGGPLLMVWRVILGSRYSLTSVRKEQTHDLPGYLVNVRCASWLWVSPLRVWMSLERVAIKCSEPNLLSVFCLEIRRAGGDNFHILEEIRFEGCYTHNLLNRVLSLRTPNQIKKKSNGAAHIISRMNPRAAHIPKKWKNE